MAGAGGLAGALGGKGLGAIAAGLAVGIVGSSALVATGAVSFNNGGGAGQGGDGAVLQLYTCPDQGPVLGTIPRGQEVLVTGRSADGRWLQLYYPAPGVERAWINGGLQVDGDINTLPVARCEAPAEATPRPTPEPTPTPTPTPTPSPTPTASSTPTASPTPNAAPKVSGLAASRSTISYDTGDYCPSSPTSVNISVSASDADGTDSVTLFFRRPGTSSYASKPMHQVAEKWTATLDTTADGIKTAGDLFYYVVAKDKNSSPKSTRSPKSGGLKLTVKVCKNTGPTFTSRVANPTTIGTGPDLCGYVMNSAITVKATDQDGIKSITLYFKGPGLSSWKKQTLNLEETRTSATGFGDIDPNRDGITRSGTISWYVVAVDDKGASTTSAKKSITVKRCDQEARYLKSYWSPARLSVGASCGFPTAVFRIGLTDPDAAAGKLKTRFYWALYRASGALIDSGNVAGTYYGDLYYQASIPSKSAWYEALREAGSGVLRITRIDTTDPYGGTTRFDRPDVGSLVVYPC